MSADSAHTTRRNRNRWMLVAIVAIFFGSLLGAGLLRFSGWRPHGMKNHGELLQPPGDLRQVVPVDAAGRAYAWNPIERTWRIALAPPAGCAQQCQQLAKDIDTVWQLMGKDADQVHVLWIGTPPVSAPRPATLHVLVPSAALRGGLPRVDDPRGVPVYVIDPNGFVILRYAPGFDPAGLRADLAKLVKLK